MNDVDAADKEGEPQEEQQQKEEEEQEVKEEEEEEGKVGLVVVRGPASDHATACTASELAKAGLSRMVRVEVAFAAMLVGAAQVRAD